jgi:GNAT superfamily N-acetyltransferase
MALAERTIAEALRVFAPHAATDGARHGSTSVREPISADEVLTMVDDQTLASEPRANAVLVYGPAPMLLETLRFDLSPEEWRPFSPTLRGPSADRFRVGALRGGVLVALATAGAPVGRLSRLRVVVSPAFRQIGLGHLVLHRAVQAVLRDGLLPYATLVPTDLGARALARAVGFVTVNRTFGGLAPA